MHKGNLFVKGESKARCSTKENIRKQHMDVIKANVWDANLYVILKVFRV